MTDYQLYILAYLAGRDVTPPAPGEDYEAALDALRRAGFILSLGSSHYLSNAGKSILRWIDGHTTTNDMALGR
jgi:hypothetical protein